MRAAQVAACERLDDGVSGAGSQLVVLRGAAPLCNLALGEALPGRAMAHDTVQALLCLTKPLVAAAVCNVAAAHGISLDDDMTAASPRLARMAAGRSLTLRDVLAHRAGLRPVMSAGVLFLPETGRVERSQRLEFAPELQAGVDHAYSDFQGANVLRHWLEDVSGLPFGVCLREYALDPLGIDDMFFGVTERDWTRLASRVGVHYDMDNGLPRPLLHELLHKHADDAVMQVVGGYGTAVAVARFYRAVLDGIGGRAFAGLPSTEVLRTMVHATAPPAADPVLRSTLSYGLGFMTDLHEALSPLIGARAFGHIGVLGGSFAFADPDLDLVVAYASNGFPYAPADRHAVLTARAAVIDAIYNDVAVTA